MTGAMSVRTTAAKYEVSESTIRDAINKQILPARRVGRVIRIGVDDAQAWFEGLIRVGSEDDT